jgi:hypothetical protein
VNREFILFHLGQAATELARTRQAIEDRPGYGYDELRVAATRLYHHINTAWNARDESVNVPAESSEEDFARWRQFPTDLDLGSE